MIPVTCTTKMFFNRFTHQVTLKLSFGFEKTKKLQDEQHQIQPYKDWLTSNCIGKHKSVASWSTSHNESGLSKICQMRVYLDNTADLDAFIDAHRDSVISAKSPINERCEALIRAGVILDVRDSLYYNRFRYKIHFRKWWDTSTRKQITSSVRDMLHDRSKKKQEYLISRYGASLYLSNEEDLVIVKMSMSDVISKITYVVTGDGI